MKNLSLDEIKAELCNKLRDVKITPTRVNQIIKQTMSLHGILNRDVAIYALANNCGIDIRKSVPDDIKEDVGKAIRMLRDYGKMDQITSTKISPQSAMKKAITKTSSKEPRIIKYLDISILPDEFYIKLQNQINRCYTCKVYSGVQILLRKFLENLIIEILRKKYGIGSKEDVEIYYDINNNRFHDFTFLLKNFEEKIEQNDFMGFPAFNKDLIKKISKYRDIANKTTHTLEIDITKDIVDNEKTNIEFLINVLVKGYNAIQQKS